jgi:hypothetical protein
MAKIRMVEEIKMAEKHTVENKIYAPPVIKTQSVAEIAKLLKEDMPPKIDPSTEDVPPKVDLLIENVEPPMVLTGTYLVIEAKIVSFNGHITYLPKGTIVNNSSYGPGAIEKLLAAGVKLEKLV